jgi:glyoxylase-like metal-dependent hydrolase (beta-lactamase superfamily II)
MIKFIVLFISCSLLFILISCAGIPAEKSRMNMPVDPVPESAYGPMIPMDKGYVVEEIGDGLYWLADGSYQTMFLTTGEGVIVVDAPPSMGEKILMAISEVTDEPITHVIYSHAHADHIAAAGIYPEDATYIAHDETLSQLEQVAMEERDFPFGIFVGGSMVPIPALSFTDTYTLTVGSQTLILDYHGANHEPGNIFIYAPKQKVLMLVDVIFPGWVPFMYLALAEDVQGFIKSHDQVLEYDFDHFIGGHLTRLGTPEDVQIQKEYINDIIMNSATALQTVDFMGIATEVGFENPWNLFDRYLHAVTEESTKRTLEKWRGKLGGADIWTFKHSSVIVESLRIE